MDMLMQRVELLEQDSSQIQRDLAVLNARSETFATKSDLAEFRTEMHQANGALRNEIQQEAAQLRGEMQQGMSQLRSEMQHGMGQLRSEVHQGLSQLRGEMQQGIGEMRKEMSGLYQQLAIQTRWIIGTLVGLAALCMTAAKLLF